MKVLSFIIAMIMIVTFISPIYAKGEDVVKKAILKVREYFDIPMDFDDVSTDIYGSDINIMWGYKDEEKEDRIRATVTRNGTLVEFYNYRTIEGGSIRLQDAKKYSKDLLEKLYKNRDFEFYEISMSYDGESYNLQYGVKLNKIPVYNARFSFSYNKGNGQLERYNINLNAKFISNENFKPKKPQKTVEQAYESILNEYNIVLMIKNINGKYHPYYELRENSPIIDADDLSIVNLKEDNNYDKVKETANTNYEAKISKAEQSAIDTIKGLKTVKEAEKKAREIFNISRLNKLINSKLISTYDNRYFYYLRFGTNDEEYGYTSVIDAMDLMPLNYYESLKENNKKSDEKKILKSAEKFLDSIGVENYKLYKKEIDKNSADIIYLKEIDGYLVEDDRISLSFSGNKLFNYQYSRINKKIEYKKKKFDYKKASELIKKDNKLKLFIYPISRYNKTDEEYQLDEFKLVYAFEDRLAQLDAVTGKFYQGYNEERLIKPTGTAKLDIVEAVELGAGVVNEKTYQDKFSYEDLLKNYSILKWGYITSDISNMIRFKDVLKFLNKVDITKPVKAEEMAKILVLLNYGFNSNDLKDEFFKDIDNVSDGYKGYVAIVRSIGWDNLTNWNEPVTVEQGLWAIQKLIY